MNLKEVLTKDLVDELASRVDTLLVLGMVFKKDQVLTYHRRFTGQNSWAMYGPLLAEIRWLNDSFDNAEEVDGPENVVEF